MDLGKMGKIIKYCFLPLSVSVSWTSLFIMIIMIITHYSSISYIHHCLILNILPKGAPNSMWLTIQFGELVNVGGRQMVILECLRFIHCITSPNHQLRTFIYVASHAKHPYTPLQNRDDSAVYLYLFHCYIFIWFFYSVWFMNLYRILHIWTRFFEAYAYLNENDNG